MRAPRYLAFEGKKGFEDDGWPVVVGPAALSGDAWVAVVMLGGGVNCGRHV